MALGLVITKNPFNATFENGYARIATCAVHRQRGGEHVVMLDVDCYASQPADDNTQSVHMERLYVPLHELPVRENILESAYAWLKTQPMFISASDVNNDPDGTPTVSQYTSAVQNVLDLKAREFGYDGILSDCSYVGSSVPKVAAEADAFKTWRYNTWSFCYQLLAQVEAGTLAAPSVAELLVQLPAFTAPV